MSSVMTTDGQELLVGLLAGVDEEVESESKESKADEGRLLGFESIKVSDITLARDETWWDGVCEGSLSPDLRAHSWQVLPGESAGRDRVKGFMVDVKGPRRSFRKQFATRTMANVARRAALQFREQEALGTDENYSFFLTTRPADAGPSPAAASEAALQATRVSEPLQFEHDSLTDWLSRSQPYAGPVGTDKPCPDEKLAGETMPAFIPRSIWNDAHDMSRLGGENESAAVLTGHLTRDTDSSQVFLVVTDCLRAEHAEEEQFSVGFSGETWALMRDRVEQRRRRLKRPSEMIVGTAHGHNFKPSPDANGRMTCDACAVLEVCSRSTCHASDDDLRFHQSVFTEAPWAQLLLWGWNARDEEEWRMYGLQDATLTPRIVRIVED